VNRSNVKSAIDPLDLPRSCHEDRSENAWYQGQQILQRITRRNEDDHAKGGLDEILLELKVPIGRHEDLETRLRGPPQQLPVSESSPALLLDRADVMAKEFWGQLSR
jgi:hypothetical protein